MLYKKCSELPLALFIKIVLEDDLKLLIRSGEHTTEEVNAAWESIYSEYFELSGAQDARHLVQTARAILIAENKIDIINACVPILRMKENALCYAALAKIGYPLKQIADPVERNREIDKLISRAKSLVHIVASCERELRRVTDQDKGGKPTEQDYIESIASLSKFQGYRIDPELTTVAEYVAIQRHYKLTLENGKQRVH